MHNRISSSRWERKCNLFGVTKWWHISHWKHIAKGIAKNIHYYSAALETIEIDQQKTHAKLLWRFSINFCKCRTFLLCALPRCIRTNKKRTVWNKRKEYNKIYEDLCDFLNCQVICVPTWFLLFHIRFASFELNLIYRHFVFNLWIVQLNTCNLL